MIVLTGKSAKRFKVPYSSLSAVASGAWVIDCLKLYRGPLLLLCTHQDSLYTLIRSAARIKSLDKLAKLIHHAIPSATFSDPLSLHKNGNTRVTGSMTDMKNMIRHWLYVEHTNIPTIQAMINDCPFSAINYDKPKNRIHA